MPSCVYILQSSLVERPQLVVSVLKHQVSSRITKGNVSAAVRWEVRYEVASWHTSQVTVEISPWKASHSSCDGSWINVGALTLSDGSKKTFFIVRWYVLVYLNDWYEVQNGGCGATMIAPYLYSTYINNTQQKEVAGVAVSVHLGENIFFCKISRPWRKYDTTWSERWWDETLMLSLSQMCIQTDKCLKTKQNGGAGAVLKNHSFYPLLISTGLHPPFSLSTRNL